MNSQQNSYKGLQIILFKQKEKKKGKKEGKKKKEIELPNFYEANIT